MLCILHSFIHSFSSAQFSSFLSLHSFHLFVHSFHSFHSFIHPFIRLFVHSFNHSFIISLFNSSVQPSKAACTTEGARAQPSLGNRAKRMHRRANSACTAEAPPGQIRICIKQKHSNIMQNNPESQIKNLQEHSLSRTCS